MSETKRIAVINVLIDSDRESDRPGTCQGGFDETTLKQIIDTYGNSHEIMECLTYMQHQLWCAMLDQPIDQRAKMRPKTDAPNIRVDAGLNRYFIPDEKLRAFKGDPCPAGGNHNLKFIPEGNSMASYHECQKCGYRINHSGPINFNGDYKGVPMLIKDDFYTERDGKYLANKTGKQVNLEPISDEELKSFCDMMETLEAPGAGQNQVESELMNAEQFAAYEKGLEKLADGMQSVYAKGDDALVKAMSEPGRDCNGDIPGEVVNINSIGSPHPIEIKLNPESSCNGNCGMNYCDDNGCIERKRSYVGDVPTAGEDKATQIQPFQEYLQEKGITPQPVNSDEATESFREINGVVIPAHIHRNTDNLEDK